MARRRSMRTRKTGLEENPALFRAPLLTREEGRRLGARAVNGDKEARKALIEANTRLVLKIAKRNRRRLKGYGVTVDDLFSEGVFGLIRASDKFDPDRHSSFATYAGYWVRHFITEAVHFQSTIRVPNYLAAAVKEDRTPFGDRQAEKYKTAYVERAGLALQIQHFSEDDFDPVCSASEERDSDGESEEEVARLLAKLPDPDREILACRFGLDGRGCWTLRELSEKFGLAELTLMSRLAHALKQLAGKRLDTHGAPKGTLSERTRREGGRGNGGPGGVPRREKPCA